MAAIPDNSRFLSVTTLDTLTSNSTVDASLSEPIPIVSVANLKYSLEVPELIPLGQVTLVPSSGPGTETSKQVWYTS